MYLVPEKELYTIIQQFHSGKFQDIANLDLDTEFDFSNILYDIQANFYKIRSLIKLGNLNDASNLLNKLNSKLDSFTNSNQIDLETSNLIKIDINTLNAFIDYKNSNLIDSNLLNSIDSKTPSLALIYKKIIQNDLDSFNNIDSPDLDLESYIFTLL